MKAQIVTLPGDGIGPEVTAAAQAVLAEIGELFGHSFEFRKRLIGGASIEECGSPLTDETITDARTADAVLLGAVGGPRWDRIDPAIRPERGLLRLRKELGVFANLRPVSVFPQAAGLTPFRSGHLDGVNILVVRELTGGAYFGQPRFRESKDGIVRAVDTTEYTVPEIERVARTSFELARRRSRKVTSVDKANVLETSRLWRETVTLVAGEYPDVVLEHMLVDTAAMRIILAPKGFDVLLTENLFGDILTDEASVLAGSLGMLPSASLGSGKAGLYEPIHGSAPDIAGKDKANPVGAILSGAMLLRYSLGLESEALAVEHAVADALGAGNCTADLGGACSTTAMTSAVIKFIHTTHQRQEDGRNGR